MQLIDKTAKNTLIKNEKKRGFDEEIPLIYNI